MTNEQLLHFEKGQAYIGQGTTRPVDMSRPEFQGLKEIVSKQQVADGDYRWDQDTRALTPAAEGGRQVL